MENTFSTYKNWGIDGLKFGFVNVGSQYWTEWLHDAVRLAADHELVVDIHDNYCPTGWSRTFPNLMTQEGIKGDESSPSIENTLRILYTRMLAGAADHTYCYYDSRVTSKYSKAFQLAKAVVFYSPVQFLYWYDRPSAYSSGDTEIEFWDSMPTVWDDTKALKGEIGEYATIARKSGEEWYIGSITDDSRVLEIPLDFLDHTKWYMAHMYTTGSSSAEVRIGRYLVHYGVTLRAGLPDNGGQAVRLVPATESDIQEYKNVQGPGWDKDIADWPSGSESGPGNGIHIGILSPDNNTSIMLGTDLEVSVSAEDEDGSIERLELYLNDSLTAQVSLSSNTFTCEGLSAGAYSVEAKAYDDQGNSEAESISVEVYDPDAEPVEFSPTDDAYLESGTGYNDEYLKVEPGTRVTYLKFDVSDFGGAEIAEAHLNLTCSADGGEGLIRVYSGTGSWTEEGINQTDAPSKGDEIASLERQFSEGSEYTLDVSQAFGETGVNTFIIEMESGGNDVWFSSKEGDATPTLILNTSSNTLISEGVKGGATELSIATGRLNISGARGRIRFSLAQESYTELNMYNTRGVLLDRLVSERMGPGLHSAGFNTQSLSSGIYFLTLRNGGKMVTGSVVLIR